MQCLSGLSRGDKRANPLRRVGSRQAHLRALSLAFCTRHTQLTCWTIRVPPVAYFVKAQLERVEGQKTSHERLPNAEDDLQGFRSLQHTNDSGEHTDDAPISTGADHTRLGRMWE